MNNISNIKKVFILAIAVIIIAGLIMIGVKGFNYSLLYSRTQRMNIYMTQDFEINDIKEIAKEVLGNRKLKVQLGNTFGTVASIVSEEITEEEQNDIINKINEKYSTEIKKDNDVVVTVIPEANAWDLIVKYISPIIITTIIVLVYFVIRFKEQGMIKCIGIPVLSLILVNLLYISIIALTRIPVNEFFAIFGILIYFLTIIYNTMKLEKEQL